jgi:predicted RNA-binding Zn ribbon-like protein
MHDADRPAPGELLLIEQFVNTLDTEEGTDALDGAWALSAGLAPGELGSDDVERLVRFREALRAVLLAHNGVELDDDAVGELAALGQDAAVVVGFGPSGEPRLEAAASSGASAVIARLLAVIARADAEGTWERLKICPADDCLWAFYDFSRNHSRTWCDMRVCGNRAKARAFRSRQN